MSQYGFTEKEMQYLQPEPIRQLNRRTRILWHTNFWGIIIFLVLMTAVFIRWSEWHTVKVEASYGAYEKCVQDTYGVSATKFYQVYGRAANCK